jgi:hypothetical protein
MLPGEILCFNFEGTTSCSAVDFMISIPKLNNSCYESIALMERNI